MLGFASVSELPISALPAGAPAAPADPPDGKQSTRTAPEPLRNAGAAFVLGSALALLSAGPALTPVRPYEALLTPQVQKKFDVVNTSQGTPATLTNVTVVPRLATLSPQKLPPAFLPAASAPNLLVTTLGVVDAPSKNVFLAAPERARDVVSTAAGTPKTLSADPALPTGKATLLTVERQRDVVDTSRGTAAAALQPAQPTLNVFLAAPERARDVASTAAGTPKTLSADPALPTGKATLLTVERQRDVADTSRGATAAALQPVQPTLNVFLAAPERARDVVSTAAGTPKTLSADPALPAGKATLLTVERQRDVVDTSRGLLPPAAQPARNLPQAAPERPQDRQDTARGTPKALYADGALPAGQSTLLNPERARDLQGTARGTPATLAQPTFPVKNVFLAAPERARDVVSTAAGTPKALHADSTLPAGQSTLLNPERLRDVVSTAASTPATLAPPGEVTPPEPPPAEDELPGGIENTARPNVRIKGLTGAAPAPFAPRPMAGELPSPTVEQLTPVVARVRPASAAPTARAAARLGEIPAARPAAAAGAAKALPPAPRFRTLPAIWVFPTPATAAPQVRPATPALVSDPALERAALDAENARIAAELALRLLGD